ncbi:RyR domain-containing protein [Mycobacterium sp. RTGN5]|uniref:RyR domain-containing protein n=1 Tax=Mycobacterium sp. RTGN5 TaxID=3016522 RepID=UPI0029C708BD|nr:RyR domain-containing protein [Mycobacterium sp. RTGN5]
MVVALVALGWFGFHSPGGGRTGAPVAVVAALLLITTVLGFASYWRCFDDDNPKLFTPLIWTAGLVKGGTGDHELAEGAVCPLPAPIALDLARLTATAAIFLSVIGIATALFQSRMDRLRISLARSVTAVVDIDDDAASVVGAVRATLDRRSTLVVITASPARECVRDARGMGARIATVDFAKPEALTALPLWRKLDKLYLLSPDPSANVRRLALITERLAAVRGKQRIPLIVRIDDPWQAAAWRAQHFGGAETRWAADTVGKYEVTARRLLDDILGPVAIERILVCGASQLTLALCAEMVQRQLEWDYYSAPDRRPLPPLTLVAESAEEFKEDHLYAHRHLGPSADHRELAAMAKSPSVPLLISLIDAAPTSTAVILVDDPHVEASTGTRLAARYPTTPIYAWHPDAQPTDDRTPLVGQLYIYQLSMHMPEGKAHDTWERAARLIHDRYVADIQISSAATLPWDQLSEFYRGSNRRQVQNALWMVETIGGHTWNTFGHAPDSVLPTAKLRDLAPLERLQVMGFEEDTAIAMARSEHEDWCRYYRRAGWKYGPVRDDANKIHNKLVEWDTVTADPNLLSTALASLADTLSKLRELGYMSRLAPDGSAA